MSALDELLDAYDTGDPSNGPMGSKLARAELAALRERVAKLEAALAKADELEVSAANVGHCIGCAEFQDCDVHLIYNPRLAYRTAREAAK